MKKLLLAGTTVLLMATSASTQNSFDPGMGLHSGMGHGGGCDNSLPCEMRCNLAVRNLKWKTSPKRSGLLRKMELSQ